ncbi:MAG: hypothetical protein JWP78_1397 [Mucilaginibacter sp.]|nr:hypothetical protein [Mucilaginibacter sp.]
MNKEKDEDLDNLFKKRLEDPVSESTFRDQDWDAMEQMLDKGKKRPVIIYWLPVIGSAAALLLIFLGYLFLKPEVVKPKKQGQTAAAHRHNADRDSNKEKVAPKDYAATNRSNPSDQKKDNTGTSGEPARQAADHNKQKTLTSAKYAGNPARLRHGQKSKSFFTLPSPAGRRDTTGYLARNRTAGAGTETIAIEGRGKNLLPDTTGRQAVIADNMVSDKKKSGIASDRTELGTADNKQQKDKSGPNALVKVKGKGPQKSGNRPQFALGVFASSDLNGVNSSFQQSKIGGNFGAVLSVTFARKWTISGGAMYDIKPYLTSFDNYHTAYQFKTQPSSVNANCRMLDIPLNINYQVYSQQGNKITLGTGLSSYFMLREDYKFNYPDSYYASGPAAFTVINKNRNILSVLNLDATYTHQINSKVGLTVQPYLKVPLSDVGASQVRLQSTGVALGLSWSLNASSKPK